MSGDRRRMLARLMAALAGVVKRGMDAPPEVLSYFRDKEMRPGFSWQDVWGEEHALAFTVAGVTEAKVLAEFRAGIDKAIVEGRGFEAFREEMAKRLTPRGWWGPREVEDHEGGAGGRDRPKLVDFSQARRLETTFWSNMRAARAAGQWDRAQRTKSALPFILYVRTTAADPRQEHLRWAGIILPVDDPFWRTHWTPNGWGCKCAVRQISASQRDRYLEAHKGADGIWYTDQAPPLDLRPFRNRRTGEVTMVPAGIDPGWHTNPGIGRAKTLGQQLVDRLAEQTPAVARAMTERFVQTDGFASFVYRAHQRGEPWDKLESEEKALREVRRAHWDDVPMPLAVVPQDVLPAGTRALVTVTDYGVAHNPKHAMAPFEWARVQRLLEIGEVRSRKSDGALQMFVPRAEGGWWYLILHPTPGGHWRLGTQMRAKDDYVDKERKRGVQLRPGTGEIVAEGRP